jgi:hypothetical protein
VGASDVEAALVDALEALGELISRGFTEEGRREFQRSRAQESRALGEAAEKRNARGESSTRWGVLAQGVLMKAVEIVTRGKLRF